MEQPLEAECTANHEAYKAFEDSDWTGLSPHKVFS